jgi:aminoglycoside phosphotransferase family enzyme/adenylate kinase family enzyme
VTAWAEVTETHTAAVFFAGERAFKVKKPLRFDFVDLRDVAERVRVCEREVELNRRLSPDVYLGVARLRLPDGTEEPAVVMRRLPRDRRLRVLVTGGVPEARDAVSSVARLVATFHARQPPCRPERDPVARLRRLWDQVLSVPVPVAPPYDEIVAECRRLAERYVAGRRPLFVERVAHGRIRDGHGDLQADDIFVLEDGPRVLDCLEFDDDLRLDDVLLDICFLAMDLERLGAPALARLLLTDYRELAGETHPASLEHFYIAYRAAVRANVTLIRARQGEEFAVQRAHALLRLSLQHLRAATPVLLLVGGLPGAGKTTVAEAVAAQRDWLVLSSDVVRKQQHGRPLVPNAGDSWRAGLYSETETARVYTEMLDRAHLGLGRGESVVLDASWSDATWRRRAREVAAATSAVVVEMCCVASDEVAAERLTARTTGASDATADIRERMALEFTDWPEAVLAGNGNDPVAVTLAAVDAAVVAGAPRLGTSGPTVPTGQGRTVEV